MSGQKSWMPYQRAGSNDLVETCAFPKLGTSHLRGRAGLPNFAKIFGNLFQNDGIRRRAWLNSEREGGRSGVSGDAGNQFGRRQTCVVLTCYAVNEGPRGSLPKRAT